MTAARLQPASLFVDKVCVYGHKKEIMLLSAWPACIGVAGLQADHQASGRSQVCSADGVTSHSSTAGLSLVNLALTVVRSVNVHRAKIQFYRLIDPAHARRQPDVLEG